MQNQTSQKRNERLLRGEKTLYFHTVCLDSAQCVRWQRSTRHFHQIPLWRRWHTSAARSFQISTSRPLCMSVLVFECVSVCVVLHFFTPQLTVKTLASNRLLTGAGGRWWHHLRPIAGLALTHEREDGWGGWRDGDGRKGWRDGAEELF